MLQVNYNECTRDCALALNGLVFFVRLGGKSIEFEKGKAGVAVPTTEKLRKSSTQ